jgi:hypothetical protein
VLQNVTAILRYYFSENEAILGIVSKSFVLGSPVHYWKEVVTAQSERIFCVVLTEELNLICPVVTSRSLHKAHNNSAQVYYRQV